MENKGELWENHVASVGAAAVGEKGMSWDEMTSNSVKIKPIALAVIELRLSEGTSQSVSQSLSRKFD